MVVFKKCVINILTVVRASSLNRQKYPSLAQVMSLPLTCHLLWRYKSMVWIPRWSSPTCQCGNSCTCMWCVFKFFLSIETQASNCFASNHCSLFHTLHSIFASLPESAESEQAQMKLEYSQGNNGLLSCYQRLI